MNKKKILIVDDDKIILELLQDSFEMMGYSVETVENANNLQTSLKNSIPDLILMDVSMPEKDGISLCRDIRFSSLTKDIPIIMITAYNDEKTYHDAMLFGAADFITKPFDIKEVQNKIEKCILKADAKKQAKK